MHKLAIFGLFFLFSGLFGETVVPTATRGNENVTVQISRQSRASRDAAYRGLIVCAFRYDTGCFLDVAKQFLDSKRVELLAEADAEVARASGSTSTTNKPSQVAQTIEKLFTDLAGLFREGFANIFGVQENDDELAANKGKDTEENDDDEEDDDKKENTSRDIGEKKNKNKNSSNKNIKQIEGKIAKTGVTDKGNLEVIPPSRKYRMNSKFMGLRKNTTIKKIKPVSPTQRTDLMDLVISRRPIPDADLILRQYLLKQSRKEKKKGKLKEKIMKLVKLAITGFTIISVLNYLIKIFYAILAFGWWLLKFKYFLLHAVKFVIWLKNYIYGGGGESVVLDHPPEGHHYYDSHDSTHREFKLNSMGAKKAPRSSQKEFDLDSLAPKKRWGWEDKAQKLHDARYSPPHPAWYMIR
ncbi:uncharacterized protein LOC126892510 isoform X1 [Diabrotica virgifera virgifera]|uniref:Uncharacterized protein n=2 Tax=Diabrotica virgifera virgifera TaxID=50390 RepID=A0ABM5L6F5_DIAVI|nr:uncharacterized protein LOC126892510 isoform X1 [Diabrotica virgifera virgifera]